MQVAFERRLDQELFRRGLLSMLTGLVKFAEAILEPLILTYLP